MSFGLTLTVIIVVPFIIAGVAFIEHIFGTCICNALKAHTHFGKCHFRDTDIELVRRQLFCPFYFVPSETWRGSVPTGALWGSASLHVLLT